MFNQLLIINYRPKYDILYYLYYLYRWIAAIMVLNIPHNSDTDDTFACGWTFFLLTLVLLQFVYIEMNYIN